MSEVRSRSREDPMPEGRRPRGVTPRPRSEVAAGRSYSTSEVRGGSPEELPRIRGQGQHPRPGAAARRRNPTSKEQWLHGCKRA